MLRLRRMPLAQLRLRALLKPSQSKPYGFASSPKGESFIKVKIMSETKLSHFDASGSAVMVDVSEKPVTARQAVARGIITMNAAAFAAVRDGTAQKGDSIANDGIFICYAPFDDPEIAMAIVVQKGGAGANCSVIAQEILEAYFSLKSATDVTDVEGELLQ